MIGHRYLYGSVLTSLAWCLATPAVAQDAGTAASAPSSVGEQPEQSGIADIVVTARRTEENLQTTPVAVTALGSETIKQAQITDAISIQRSAPSLSIATGSPGSSGFTYVSIRGAGTLNPGVANDPSVAIYQDGVYIPRPSQGVTDLVDIQRVEVLRGPQGTLFGRNTTGGALNIISENPTGEFGGEVRGQIGNYDLRNVGATLNVPLMGEELAARITYDFTDRDGFARDITTGRELNDRNSHFVRGKLRWAPADSDWSVILSVDYNRLKDKGQFVALTAALPGPPAVQFLKGILPGGLGNVPGIVDFPVDLNQYAHDRNDFYRTYNQPFVNNPYGIERHKAGDQPYNYLKAYGGALTIDGKLGDINVKSITGYRYSFSIGSNDLDGTPVPVLATSSYYLSKQFSQELQFSGDLSDRLSYIFGGYYSRETGVESSLSQSFGYSPVLAAAPNRGYALNLADVTNKTIGAYGQMNYELTDRLRFTGGLRWTFDKRNVVLKNATVLAPVRNCAPELVALGVGADCALSRDAKFDYPAWTGSLDFKAMDNLFVYAKTSGASKAGGFNLRNGTATTPAFKPEKVRDVELGFKLDAFDRRVRLNVAGFYSWQSDVQRNAAGVFLQGGVATTSQFLLNAGKQRIYGAEFELTVVPWTGMTVASNLTLMRGHYVDGSFTEVRDIPSAGLAGCTPSPSNPAVSRCIVDRSGEVVPQRPKTQFNIAATQRLPVSIGEIVLHGSYSYISSQYYDTQTADPREPAATQAIIRRQNALGRQPGYGLLDGRVALELNNPKIELFLFGKNLTQKKYTTRPFNGLYSQLGIAFEYIGSPRTYGGGAIFRF